jgi:hypothetical protein
MVTPHSIKTKALTINSAKIRMTMVSPLFTRRLRDGLRVAVIPSIIGKADVRLYVVAIPVPLS